MLQSSKSVSSGNLYQHGSWVPANYNWGALGSRCEWKTQKVTHTQVLGSYRKKLQLPRYAGLVCKKVSPFAKHLYLVHEEYFSDIFMKCFCSANLSDWSHCLRKCLRSILSDLISSWRIFLHVVNSFSINSQTDRWYWHFVPNWKLSPNFKQKHFAPVNTWNMDWIYLWHDMM